MPWRGGEVVENARLAELTQSANHDDLELGEDEVRRLGNVANRRLSTRSPPLHGQAKNGRVVGFDALSNSRSASLREKTADAVRIAVASAFFFCLRRSTRRRGEHGGFGRALRDWEGFQKASA